MPQSAIHFSTVRSLRTLQWLLRFWFLLCRISSINWSPFAPSVWNWTPWVQSFPMHFALPWLLAFEAKGAQRSKRTYWKRLMRVAQSMTISFPLRPPCGLVATPSAEIRLGHICLLWLIYFFDLFVHLSVLTVSNVIYTYNLYCLWNTSKQCICTTCWTKIGKA